MCLATGILIIQRSTCITIAAPSIPGRRLEFHVKTVANAASPVEIYARLPQFHRCTYDLICGGEFRADACDLHSRNPPYSALRKFIRDQRRMMFSNHLFIPSLFSLKSNPCQP